MDRKADSWVLLGALAGPSGRDVNPPLLLQMNGLGVLLPGSWPPESQ